MFGGKLCGDDGKWSDQCVIAYCGEGYIYDKDKQECITDSCWEYVQSLLTTIILVFIAIMIGIMIFIIIVISVIVFVIIFAKRRSSKSKKQTSKETNYVPLQNEDMEQQDII